MAELILEFEGKHLTVLYLSLQVSTRKLTPFVGGVTSLQGGASHVIWAPLTGQVYGTKDWNYLFMSLKCLKSNLVYDRHSLDTQDSQVTKYCTFYLDDEKKLVGLNHVPCLLIEYWQSCFLSGGGYFYKIRIKCFTFSV